MSDVAYLLRKKRLERHHVLQSLAAMGGAANRQARAWLATNADEIAALEQAQKQIANAVAVKRSLANASLR